MLFTLPGWDPWEDLPDSLCGCISSGNRCHFWGNKNLVETAPKILCSFFFLNVILLLFAFRGSVLSDTDWQQAGKGGCWKSLGLFWSSGKICPEAVQGGLPPFSHQLVINPPEQNTSLQPHPSASPRNYCKKSFLPLSFKLWVQPVQILVSCLWRLRNPGLVLKAV